MVSTDFLIVIYNNFTFSIATIVLLSTLLRDVKRLLAAFVLIFVVGLVFTFFALPNWIMPINTILLTLCFAVGIKEPKKYRRIFFYCLTVTTISWCAIALLSSLIMLITPSWLYTVSYNLFMGGMMLGGAFVVWANKNIMNWCKHLEHERHAIVLELVVLLFFSFVLPLYYPAIYADNARQWGVFVLSFIIVLAIVGLLINRMKYLENERRSLKYQMEQQKSFAGHVQSQFERIITLKHYYNRLYHSLAPYINDNDMDGLRLYFHKHVTPIHQTQIQNKQVISKIRNDLLRNLLDVTVGQIAVLENVLLDLDIQGDINVSENAELDVFEIMSNLLDNALRETRGQPSGLLKIRLHESNGELSIQVANTLGYNLDIEQIYSHRLDDGERGFGLKRVREIVYQHPNMSHLTYKSGMFEGKEILVQQITIFEDGE